MMRPWLAMPALAVVVLMLGCAKQPTSTGASVAAPTGGAQVSSGANSAQGRQAGQTGQTYGRDGSGTASGTRPAPGDYVAAPQLEDVHFEYDKYEIRSDDARSLETTAAWLKANPERLLLIEGHCDERGTNEYNVALGDRRARATMNYLVSHGIAARRIAIVSYGEERPVCQEHADACWAKNRRAHLLLKKRD
jgi:peptidoglycan-associated lipoprotein